jgi:hypothetical protein
LSLLLSVQSAYGAYLDSYLTVTGGSFLWVKLLGHECDHHLPLARRLRMSETELALSHKSAWCGAKINRKERELYRVCCIYEKP